MAFTYELIEKISLSTTTASFSFTSIPQTYTDLKVVVSHRTNGASSWSNILCRFNSTSSTYTNRYLQGNGGSIGQGTASGGMFGDLIQNAQQASTFAVSETYILDYSSTVHKKVYSGEGVASVDGATGFQQINTNSYDSTDAITSVQITTSNGDSFVQYSTACLYGIKRV